MPLGTGVAATHNVPLTPYTPDPASFDELTAKVVSVPLSFATPGSGQFRVNELPKAGILTWLTVVFEGSVTFDNNTGDVVTRWPWPYGLLDQIEFTANTITGLIDCNGMDLHAHRFAVNPSYSEAIDRYPGTVGGGDSPADSTADLYLTWQVPVVMDRTTLIGCIYAQSNMNALQLRIRQALNSDLVTLTGDATFAVTGTWSVTVESYEIPQNENGVITPDLSRLHGLHGFERPLAGAGDNPTLFIQENGQLQRVFIQVRPDADGFLDPRPNPGSTEWTGLRLEYGANQRPIDIDLGTLASRNNEQYGGQLPYGYVCLDQVRENARRDAIYMPGLTEFRVVPILASGVVTDANGRVRLLQESLFQ